MKHHTGAIGANVPDPPAQIHRRWPYFQLRTRSSRVMNVTDLGLYSSESSENLQRLLLMAVRGTNLVLYSFRGSSNFIAGPISNMQWVRLL